MTIRRFGSAGLVVVLALSCRGIVDSPLQSRATHLARVTSGDSSSACAINAAPGNEGPAYCWGANESGQLGNGTTTNSTTPVAISGMSFGYVAVGPHFACGLEATKSFAGPAFCWGANESGELGNGTTTNSSTPVSVSTHSFGTIAAGPNFACAINAAPGNEGPAFCWGANESGQLGNGTTTNSTTPVAISGMSFGYVAVGPHFACGLEATTSFAGPAFCWGANGSGELGNGTTTSSSTPVSVSGHSFGTSAVTPVIR